LKPEKPNIGTIVDIFNQLEGKEVTIQHFHGEGYYIATGKFVRGDNNQFMLEIPLEVIHINPRHVEKIQVNPLVGGELDILVVLMNKDYWRT